MKKKKQQTLVNFLVLATMFGLPRVYSPHKENMKSMITSSICIEEGLLNGTCGALKFITFKPNPDIPDKQWFFIWGWYTCRWNLPIKAFKHYDSPSNWRFLGAHWETLTYNNSNDPKQLPNSPTPILCRSPHYTLKPGLNYWKCLRGFTSFKKIKQTAYVRGF